MTFLNAKITVKQAIVAPFLVSLLLVTASSAPAGTTHRAETRDLKPSESAQPAEGVIVLSGMALKRGDPRERVMRELSKLYQLQHLKSSDGEEDSWLIAEKEQHDNYLGVVSFAGGKIRRVARFRKWTQDEDSIELAQRLCDLVEQLTGQRGGHLEVTAKTNDSGKYTVRGIEMISGDKRISLNLISHGDESDPTARQVEVHLDEVVQ